MVSADEDDSGEAAILLIDSSRLITEEVVCRGIRIKAVIDTGAVVSVASPSLQEKLGARQMGWDGPSVVMVNGQRAPPLGALELEIEHRGMKASGKVILLEMRGIELLLGNDFLSQFKRLQINYVPNGAELLLGELLVNVIEEQEAVKAPRLVMKTGRMLPPRAIVPVEIETTTLNEATWMIEPSEHLAQTKGLMAGKGLVSSDQPLGQVLMVNLTNRRAYLREETVLGQMETVEPSIVAVDEGETPDSLGDDVGEDSTESISDSDSTPRVTSIPRQAFRAQVASTLPPADVKKMVELLEEFDTSFLLKEGELGVCKIAEHRINTGTATPVHQSPYKSAWKEKAIVQKQVDEMLSRSVIERSTSPWASPVVLAKKKDGSWHFCVDYRRLNAISVKDVYPLPRIEETLSRIGNASIFSTLDPESGYWQERCFLQRVNNIEWHLAYASRLLSPSESNYSITEKECLALVWAVKKFRTYIWGMDTLVVSDHHALCWLLTKKDLAGRLARWSLQLQEFLLRIIHRNRRLHTDADAFSRYPVDAPQELDEQLYCTLAAFSIETE
ncbi:Uncharacterized protein APZ42_025792, partial [Daphnia magna]